MLIITEELEIHWKYIAPLLCIRNEREYDMAVKRLNELLDEIGNNEQHPPYSLLDTLGTLIHVYEDEHYPIPEARRVHVIPSAEVLTQRRKGAKRS